MADIDTTLPFPVVGIGASAGGLEAVQWLLASTIDEGPSETGLAFVLVQHLDPNHASMLADLLSRRTNLTVRQVEDGDHLSPDTLFVIPPGFGLEVEGPSLRLVPFDEPRGLRRPIDDFFVSLAQGCGENCAAIIVSGTGSDGSAGLRSIKEAGGLVLVQDPDDAKYDGMPVAAMNTGLADKVLPARDIFATVRNYFERPISSAADADSDEVMERLDDITDAVTDGTGHDFSGYKHSTMIRRVRRRMQIVGEESVRDYVELLRDSPDECDALVTDLLINVTQFYRDASAFDALRDRAIPDIVKGRTRADTIRIWVPGCSSGEEAYTIAMMVADALKNFPHPPFVQIFATDIDEQMLATAKMGRYPITALDDVPEAYRDYCTPQASGHFLIDPRIRDMVRFSSHSLIKDPPFSRLDLVSCRNLLIYLNTRLQKGVIPLFHYALKPDGFLFLGPAESLGRYDDLFNTVSSSARLYTRKEGRTPDGLTLPVGGGNLRKLVAKSRRSGARPVPNQGLAQRRILDAYAPAYMTVSDTGEVLESSGQLSRYFGFPSGQMSRHVAALAHPGLREPLTQALREATGSGKRQVLRGLEVRSEFGTQEIDLAVDPLPDNTSLIVIRDIASFRASTVDDLVELPSQEQALSALEAELDTTRVKLRSTVEELETTNEELKSSNEEMMSMNEELQSANEELTTVNDELKDKVDRLGQANDDQSNFLASTDLALVVVDGDMNIRLFTDAATDIYPLASTDIGRPLSAFSPTVGDPHILRDAAEVLRSGKETARTVSTRNRKASYAMRLLPYRTRGGAIEGVSMTFTDTTILRDARQTAEDSGNRLQLALDATNVGVWEYNTRTGHTVIDARVRNMFGLPKDAPLEFEDADRMFARVDERDLPAMQKSFEAALMGKSEYRAEFRIADADTTRWISGIGRVMESASGGGRLVGVNYDITSIKQVEQQKELLVRELDHRVKNLFAIVLGMLRAENRRTSDKDVLVGNIESRLGALSRAHEATRGAASLGEAPHLTRMSNLVELVMTPYGVGDRVKLKGDAIPLSASSATPLGLILHELATNAQKYGALSNDTGTVDVSWRRVIQSGSTEFIELRWKERGGPKLGAEGKPGFGMRLIRQSVNQLAGSMEPDWRPEGFELDILLPIVAAS